MTRQISDDLKATLDRFARTTRHKPVDQIDVPELPLPAPTPRPAPVRPWRVPRGPRPEDANLWHIEKEKRE